MYLVGCLSFSFLLQRNQQTPTTCLLPAEHPVPFPVLPQPILPFRVVVVVCGGCWLLGHYGGYDVFPSYHTPSAVAADTWRSLLSDIRRWPDDSRGQGASRKGGVAMEESQGDAREGGKRFIEFYSDNGRTWFIRLITYYDRFIQRWNRTR